jgi:hypothetical protein
MPALRKTERNICKSNTTRIKKLVERRTRVAGTPTQPWDAEAVTTNTQNINRGHQFKNCITKACSNGSNRPRLVDLNLAWELSNPFTTWVARHSLYCDRHVGRVPLTAYEDV